MSYFIFNYITCLSLNSGYLGRSLMIIRRVLIDTQALQIFVLADSSFKSDMSVLDKTRCANINVVFNKMVTCFGRGKYILVRRSSIGILVLYEVAVFGSKF